jgi:hypothetical protein
MVHRIMRDPALRLVIILPARIQIPIESREVTARHLNPNPMPRPEPVTRIQRRLITPNRVGSPVWPVLVRAWRPEGSGFNQRVFRDNLRMVFIRAAFRIALELGDLSGFLLGAALTEPAASRTPFS